MKRSLNHPYRPRVRRGFTLIEAAFVTVVIGVGAVATLQLMAVGTETNSAAAEMTVAVNLAGNIRDLMVGMPLYDPQNPNVFISREGTLASYDNITDFDGQTFVPPRDSARQPLAGYDGWSQSITVESCSEDNLGVTRADNAADQSARVTVTIYRFGRAIYQTGWAVSNTTGG